MNEEGQIERWREEKHFEIEQKSGFWYFIKKLINGIRILGNIVLLTQSISNIPNIHFTGNDLKLWLKMWKFYQNCEVIVCQKIFVSPSMLIFKTNDDSRTRNFSAFVVLKRHYVGLEKKTKIDICRSTLDIYNPFL